VPNVNRRTAAYAELTWPEIKDAANDGAAVVIPVGSTEQHGYHLPVCTDVTLPYELALALAQRLDLLVAPPITYGYRSRPLSGGGQGFPGTISVAATTLIETVRDVLIELHRGGFRRAVLLNWHFENENFVYEAAWLAAEATRPDPISVMVIEKPFVDLGAEVMELLFGDEFPGWDVEHAAIMETSLMLHLRPDLVLFDRAVDDAARRHPFYDVVPIPDDFVPASGTLWKATQASAPKGARAWQQIVDVLESAIRLELFSG
jgi:creatinine amidohydrolase